MGHMDSAISGSTYVRFRRWGWVVVALIVILFATSRRNFFQISKKTCELAESGKYTGIVEDCSCGFETVDFLNKEQLHPILQELVATPFFQYFKVKLWCDCPFWPDDGMCRLRDCSVCECPDNEFPELFKQPFAGLSTDDLICQEGKPEAAVDRTLDSKAFRGWVVVDNPWTNDDETDNEEMTYVNLQLNPERYTAYVGPSARRIWEAIYTENCPRHPSGEICPERRVLYKLISGLHASISVHIASDYLLDEATNMWGQHLELLYERVLKYPDRVRNLYFTFLFVLRAVTKLLKISPKTAQMALSDARSDGYPLWWNWLERQIPSDSNHAKIPPLDTPKTSSVTTTAGFTLHRPNRRGQPAKPHFDSSTPHISNLHHTHNSSNRWQAIHETPLLRDDASLTSCPGFAVPQKSTTGTSSAQTPNYMAPTVSAKAKVKSTAMDGDGGRKEGRRRRFSFALSQSIGSLKMFTSAKGAAAATPPVKTSGFGHRSQLSIGDLSVDSTVSPPAGLLRRPFI